MGNCRGKTSKPNSPPTKSYEEHSTTKHHLRVGVQFEKSPEGEIHVGFKGGLENKKDVVIKVDDREDDSEDVNKIPKILDIVNSNNNENYEQ